MGLTTLKMDSRLRGNDANDAQDVLENFQITLHLFAGRYSSSSLVHRF